MLRARSAIAPKPVRTLQSLRALPPSNAILARKLHRAARGPPELLHRISNAGAAAAPWIGLGLVGAAGVCYANADSWFADSSPADAVLKQAAAPDRVHVPRAIDRALEELVFKESIMVHVVQGPRGAGKSQALRAAAGGRPGLVVVKVGRDQTLIQALATRLGVGGDPRTMERQVIAALSAAIASRRAQPGVPPDWVPTLAIEVDQRLTYEALDAVFNVAKQLGCDLKLCAPFISLSDISASLYPDDLGGRINRITCNDLEFSEVEQLAVKLQDAGLLHESMATVEQRMAFARQRGTRALVITGGLRGRAGDSSGREYAAHLWECREAPGERAATHQLLKALAIRYGKARAEAERAGLIFRPEEAAVSTHELGTTAFRLAKLMRVVQAAEALHLQPDRVSFVDPVVGNFIDARIARDGSKKG